MNRALVGKVYPRLTLEVTGERILAFADAVGERSLLVRDGDAARAAGYPGRLAPPTFPTILQIMALSQLLADPDLGMDLSRLLHSEERYAWNRPVVEGDVLSARACLARIEARGGTELIHLESEIRDAAGEAVVTARTSLISREAPSAS